jgi:hypothetical protein
VPYDVAFSLDDEDRTAYCILFGQMEGQEWDFTRMSWKKLS